MHGQLLEQQYGPSTNHTCTWCDEIHVVTCCETSAGMHGLSIMNSSIISILCTWIRRYGRCGDVIIITVVSGSDIGLYAAHASTIMVPQTACMVAINVRFHADDEGVRIFQPRATRTMRPIWAKMVMIPNASRMEPIYKWVDCHNQWYAYVYVYGMGWMCTAVTGNRYLEGTHWSPSDANILYESRHDEYHHDHWLPYSIHCIDIPVINPTGVTAATNDYYQY